MIDKTKKCPLCGEEIKAEARICRFCDAQFEVAIRGYCTRCHASVEADENGKCRTCGAELADIQAESKLVEKTAPPVQPKVTPASKPAPAYPKPAPAPRTQPPAISKFPQEKLQRPGCLTAYAIFLGILVLALLLVCILVKPSPENQAAWSRAVPFLIVFMLASITLAVGIWQLKNWARIGAIILQSLMAILAVIELIDSFSAHNYTERTLSGGMVMRTYQMPACVGAGFLLMFVVYTIGWFYTEKDKFQ